MILKDVVLEKEAVRGRGRVCVSSDYPSVLLLILEFCTNVFVKN